ncbi:hypothetical protein N7494_009550 [Penicillium frequentans]|uniref:Uncharacterized protein n=1 Tax=Penicillium frequentans TaxID=3151616 RepID=A0AAD6GDI9_9EURO|nr:hypothetical protein N7494_009550 [Penicillium glabrum]
MAAVSRNQNLSDRHSQSNSNTLPPAIPQIYNRISQWMLAGWWSSCEPKSGSSARQPYQSDPTACKGCREWGGALRSYKTTMRTLL